MCFLSTGNRGKLKAKSSKVIAESQKTEEKGNHEDTLRLGSGQAKESQLNSFAVSENSTGQAEKRGILDTGFRTLAEGCKLNAGKHAAALI